MRYRAADGRPASLPVRYAVAGERYVVLVGDASMYRSVNTCRRLLSDHWFDEWRDFPPIHSMRACCPPTGGCGGPRWIVGLQWRRRYR